MAEFACFVELEMCWLSIGDFERGTAEGDLEDILPEGAEGEKIGFLFRGVLGGNYKDVGVDLVVVSARGDGEVAVCFPRSGRHVGRSGDADVGEFRLAMPGVLIVHVVCVTDELYVWCLKVYTVSKTYIKSAQVRLDGEEK